MARSSERGATLTIVAFAVSMVLLTFGSAYMVASQNTYRIATFRARQAEARAAAEAGLAIAISRVTPATPAAKGEEWFGTVRPGGPRVSWEIIPAGPEHVAVRAYGASGAGPDEVRVVFGAEVERREGERPRVLRITRD